MDLGLAERTEDYGELGRKVAYGAASFAQKCSSFSTLFVILTTVSQITFVLNIVVTS